MQAIGTSSVLTADPPRSGAAVGLTEMERSLLTLLMTGLTDDTVARRMGISVRTVRRIMADIMRRLGATSRFEAGVKVVHRGWL